MYLNFTTQQLNLPEVKLINQSLAVTAYTLLAYTYFKDISKTGYILLFLGNLIIAIYYLFLQTNTYTDFINKINNKLNDVDKTIKINQKYIELVGYIFLAIYNFNMGFFQSNINIQNMIIYGSAFLSNLLVLTPMNNVAYLFFSMSSMARLLFMYDTELEVYIYLILSYVNILKFINLL